MTIGQAMNDLATQISTVLCGTANPVIPSLQVTGRVHPNPTPPCIDMYPSDPFTEATGFGKGMKDYFIDVRARVNLDDSVAGQDLLLSMMDTTSSTSVEQAILSTTSLSSGGTIRSVEGPRWRPFGDLVGAFWTVRITP